MTTYSAVVTTGIYCRPGCGARPLLRNTRTYEHPAAAEAAGFRACLRCRPYRVAAPIAADAPELVCRTWQLIIDGALDGGTEAALAERVGLSPRHLRRLFLRHLGATPDQLARSRRAHFARRLLDDTDLTVLDVAFASGFGSLRQFNRVMREIFRASPSDLRDRRHRSDRPAADGGLVLRVPCVPGYDWGAVRGLLAARAVPGVEEVDGDVYRRTITVDGAPGVLEVAPGQDGSLLVRAHLPYWEGLIHVVGQAGRMLGADTDHAAGVAALSGDPVLGPLVRKRPGLAVPGAWNALEAGVRAVVGRGAEEHGRATALMGALVAKLGAYVPGLPGGLTHTFPEPAALTPAALRATGLGEGEAEVLGALAADAGRGHPALGHGTSRDALAALPYAGHDLRQELAFRLGHREAFPAGDPEVRAALAGLGLDPTAPDRWRPWQALAAAHLMAHGGTL
ncbi:helix-turn-helix domain-containing protein [Nonomuraea jiangxiensis]|uniref:AraC family transcriptional regulator, regulatory protein of adaptative response / DNA-3-methyladenine glycosylase II n=1 Tax=Nonomuraea jiangxiensis TaxID=633440 RepID=A0A1G8FWG3_9ACTN|nr:helix-turn-helix domain-containing protein [Nonomuraea jiangxiensis]SDH86306.1 AraC family transcriptional regulator, regulatory protein of adaptative response / DNA-3-methyladenine glycosylase II [Nonomuraea jiangxiensis]